MADATYTTLTLLPNIAARRQFEVDLDLGASSTCHLATLMSDQYRAGERQQLMGARDLMESSMLQAEAL
jgi:hypothetical protein